MSRSELSTTNKRDGCYRPATDPWAAFLSHYDPGYLVYSLTPYDYFFGPKSRVKPDVEPPPRINYHSLHLMLDLCRNSLPKHYLKRWDYLVDARKRYYCIHYKFYSEFHGLQDLRVFEDVLVTRKGNLVEQIRTWEKEGITGAVLGKKKRDLEDMMFQIEKNRAEMPVLIEKVKELARTRDQAAAWLSEMKLTLLREHMQPLVYFVKKAIETLRRQEQEEGELGSVAGPERKTLIFK